MVKAKRETGTQGLVRRLRGRVLPIEVKRIIDGDLMDPKEQAANCIEELSHRYDKALKLLRKVRSFAFRQGWEDGPTASEIVEEIDEVLSQETLEREIFGK